MTRIPESERRRVQTALFPLARLRPGIEEAFRSYWGDPWETNLSPNERNLSDERTLLRLLVTERLRQGPLREVFPLVAPGQVRRLSRIANAAFHNDLKKWREGDAARAERLGQAIVGAGLPPVELAVVGVPGHHVEVFQLREDGYAQHRWWPHQDEGEVEPHWSDWETLEQVPRSSSIAAVASSESDASVFVVTDEGKVARKHWNVETWWGKWEILPGDELVTGPLRVTSTWSEQQFDLWAVSVDGDLIHRHHPSEDVGWSDWVAFG
jgi:hypothetical protein